jgi:hypothetical protein
MPRDSRVYLEDILDAVGAIKLPTLEEQVRAILEA